MSKQQPSNKTNGVSLITLADQRSPISEQYRTIRTNIQFSMVDSQFKTLVVTSSGREKGSRPLRQTWPLFCQFGHSRFTCRCRFAQTDRGENICA